MLALCVVNFKMLALRVVNFKALLTLQVEAILGRTSVGSCDCETFVVFPAGLCLVWAGATHP